MYDTSGSKIDIKSIYHPSPRDLNLMSPDLSVVVLAYHAEDSIIGFVDELSLRLRSEEISDYEIVLVANFDKGDVRDRTPKIARRLAEREPRIRALTDPKEGMMGWDAQRGLRAAMGKVIALIDGDGQMPSEDICRAYRVMVSDEFDFVKTYRVSREDGIFRLLSSRVFNLIFHLFFPKCQFRDVNSKPKVFSRKALHQMNLNCDGWFFDGEVILEAMRLQLVFAEIPTKFRKNEWRGSFVKASAIFEMLISLLRYRFRR